MPATSQVTDSTVVGKLDFGDYKSFIVQWVSLRTFLLFMLVSANNVKVIIK